MRKMALKFAATCFAAFLAAGIAAPKAMASASLEGADCSEINNSYDEDLVTVRGEQVLSATAAQVALLRVIPSRNAGVTVQGWDRNEFVIHVCKSAAAGTREQAAELLNQITATLESGTLRSEGPSARRWMAHFVINAPRAASLNLQVENGPVSVRELTGKVEIHAENGPIAVKDCSGNVNATSGNGPISFRGEGGSMNLKTQNGPISVQLSGSSWQGSGLEASTVNGPLTVEMPQEYGSGVAIETTGRSPFSCRAKGCDNARANFSDELRSIQLGAGNTAVRVSTVNGPVSVRNRRADM